MEKEMRRKEPCTFCGSSTYDWAAVPTDETGAEVSLAPDACSMCHDYDESTDKMTRKTPQTLN
jgi:hypothetical protein